MHFSNVVTCNYNNNRKDNLGNQNSPSKMPNSKANTMLRGKSLNAVVTVSAVLLIVLTILGIIFIPKLFKSSKKSAAPQREEQALNPAAQLTPSGNRRPSTPPRILLHKISDQKDTGYEIEKKKEDSTKQETSRKLQVNPEWLKPKTITTGKSWFNYVKDLTYQHPFAIAFGVGFLVLYGGYNWFASAAIATAETNPNTWVKTSQWISRKEDRLGNTCGVRKRLYHCEGKQGNILPDEFCDGPTPGPEEKVTGCVMKVVKADCDNRGHLVCDIDEGDFCNFYKSDRSIVKKPSGSTMDVDFDAAHCES